MKCSVEARTEEGRRNDPVQRTMSNVENDQLHDDQVDSSPLHSPFGDATAENLQGPSNITHLQSTSQEPATQLGSLIARASAEQAVDSSRHGEIPGPAVSGSLVRIQDLLNDESQTQSIHLQQENEEPVDEVERGGSLCRIQIPVLRRPSIEDTQHIALNEDQALHESSQMGHDTKEIVWEKGPDTAEDIGYDLFKFFKCF